MSGRSTNRPLTLVVAVLPSTIGNLQALKKLDLYGNKIAGAYLRSANCALTTLPAALPESIGNLKALTELYASSNELTGEHLRSTNRVSDPSRLCLQRCQS